MGQIYRYFRTHPWQRRMITASMTFAIASVAAAVFFQDFVDWRQDRDDLKTQRKIIALLENPQKQSWGDALADAYELAQRSSSMRAELGRVLDGAAELQYPSLLGMVITLADDHDDVHESLSRQLEAEDDAKFIQVVSMLNSRSMFYLPHRSRLHIDRYRAYLLRSTPPQSSPAEITASRHELLYRTLLSGRDNIYVHQMAQTAATCESPRVRQVASILAGSIGSADTLRVLLDDSDSSVVSSAALNIGISKIGALTGELIALVEVGATAEIKASCIASLAAFDEQMAASIIAKTIANCDDDILRDFLLTIAASIDLPETKQIVLGEFAYAKSLRKYPNASAIIAAGQLGLVETTPTIRAILANATSKDTTLTVGQLTAAIETADRLNMNVLAEAELICRKLWTPAISPALTLASRLLGKQISKIGDEIGSDKKSSKIILPSLERCKKTLAQATQFTATSLDENGDTIKITMPIASAAAATALWLLKPASTWLTSPPGDPIAGLWKVDTASSAFYVHKAASIENSLSGDYLAWHISRPASDDAFALALSLIPPRENKNPLARREYSKHVLAAGAMMLALSANTSPQKAIAIERINSMLHRRFYDERDFVLRGSYICALCILTKGDDADVVLGFLRSMDFPFQRAAIALLSVGDKRLLDWLFASAGINDSDVLSLLINKGLGSILAASSDMLTPPAASEAEHVKLWKVKILRYTYLNRRSEISIGFSR